MFFALIVGVLFGYYYKKPDAMMLRGVSNQKTEWKKDLFIESLRSETKLFELKTSKPFIGEDGKQYFTSHGNFLFNWLAFSESVIGFLLFCFIIFKTRMIDALKLKVKPYLK
ncbi:hypothetical protein [Tenacibaculum aquimarinum]|uniref:hypothetical protein n=1 Tax=Tenacibaculum aquimarinum TaxID=2910675 RepID=UPI001F0ABE52|nr:hypothetical protein [Tenacibaculum aquimarinum]MCH3885670.1 hypothetical protein [Tenacibaculum aquimarinum]